MGHMLDEDSFLYEKLSHTKFELKIAYRSKLHAETQAKAYIITIHHL